MRWGKGIDPGYFGSAANKFCCWPDDGRAMVRERGEVLNLELEQCRGWRCCLQKWGRLEKKMAILAFAWVEGAGVGIIYMLSVVNTK